jgi:hypothetical protein
MVNMGLRERLVGADPEILVGERVQMVSYADTSLQRNFQFAVFFSSDFRQGVFKWFKFKTNDSCLRVCAELAIGKLTFA